MGKASKRAVLCSLQIKKTLILTLKAGTTMSNLYKKLKTLILKLRAVTRTVTRECQIISDSRSYKIGGI
jgi:hypothetical protein